MARREIVVLEDDLEGGTADETVKFGIDGMSYEIDLSAANAEKLREQFAQYVEVARKGNRGVVVTGGRSAGRGRAVAPPAADRDQNKAVREWAKRKGKSISERGRIPQSILDEFHAAGGR